MGQTDQRFGQLKQTYQSVQNAMTQDQVRLQNLNMQGDKLFMRSEAPSQETKKARMGRNQNGRPRFGFHCGHHRERIQPSAPNANSRSSASGGQSARTYTVAGRRFAFEDQ